MRPYREENRCRRIWSVLACRIRLKSSLEVLAEGSHLGPIRIFYWEGLLCFASFCVVLARRSVLRREARLVPGSFWRVSAVQTQLLVVSVALAVRLVWRVGRELAAGGQQGLPDLGPGWVLALGVSGAVYGAGRFWQGYRR